MRFFLQFFTFLVVVFCSISNCKNFENATSVFATGDFGPFIQQLEYFKGRLSIDTQKRIEAYLIELKSRGRCLQCFKFFKHYQLWCINKPVKDRISVLQHFKC